MGLMRDIERNLDDLETEMKWLRKRIEGIHNAIETDSEIDIDTLEKQYDDVESKIDDLKYNVVELIDTLTDLS